MRTIYHFLVILNEFVGPNCLSQYLGLTVRCCKQDFLPMMNNLFVKLRKSNAFSKSKKTATSGIFFVLVKSIVSAIK